MIAKAINKKSWHYKVVRKPTWLNHPTKEKDMPKDTCSYTRTLIFACMLRAYFNFALPAMVLLTAVAALYDIWSFQGVPLNRVWLYGFTNPSQVADLLGSITSDRMAGYAGGLQITDTPEWLRGPASVLILPGVVVGLGLAAVLAYMPVVAFILACVIGLAYIFATVSSKLTRIQDELRQRRYRKMLVKQATHPYRESSVGGAFCSRVVYVDE